MAKKECISTRNNMEKTLSGYLEDIAPILWTPQKQPLPRWCRCSLGSATIFPRHVQMGSFALNYSMHLVHSQRLHSQHLQNRVYSLSGKSNQTSQSMQIAHFLYSHFRSSFLLPISYSLSDVLTPASSFPWNAIRESGIPSTEVLWMSWRLRPPSMNWYTCMYPPVHQDTPILDKMRNLVWKNQSRRHRELCLDTMELVHWTRKPWHTIHYVLDL